MTDQGKGNGERRRLRIAQVAPLFESVPPQAYGGTERVVSYLTEELVALGHQVTLFASGDSRTAARLIAPCARALRLADCVDAIPYHLVMLEQVARRAQEFDVVHFHVDYLHYPATRRDHIAHVTTLHGRLDLPELVPLYREYQEMPVVSISNAQREPLPWLSWQATIHHGLPVDLYRPGTGAGGYLAFVGRISPEKRVDHAIEIARRAGIPLRIAAKIDRADHEYFTQQIAPLLLHPDIELVGEIGEADKQAFFGNALALVFPIDWPEPFGLVMIEALACGTPVIARRRGSVSEIIEDGVTGFVFTDLDGAVAAVERVPALSRTSCRRAFERRFTATRMATDYLDVYRHLEITHEQRIEAGVPGLRNPGDHAARR
jgi:glycosyltransferase involved in cell wall biosynthesis